MPRSGSLPRAWCVAGRAVCLCITFSSSFANWLPPLHCRRPLQFTLGPRELPRLRGVRCFRVYLRSDWMAQASLVRGAGAAPRARGPSNRLFAHIWDLVKFGAVELPLLRWDQDETGHWHLSIEPGSFLEEILVRGGGGGKKERWGPPYCPPYPSPPLAPPLLLPLIPAPLLQGGDFANPQRVSEVVGQLAGRLRAELPGIQEDALRRNLCALQAQLKCSVRPGGRVWGGGEKP